MKAAARTDRAACVQWSGTPDAGARCGATDDVRLTLQGPKCATHRGVAVRCAHPLPTESRPSVAEESEAARMDPTPEQVEALATYGDGIDLVLQAGAGCGKTTMLKLLAKSDPRARMTYIAYNKAIKADAARSMPANVMAKTGHGLAFDARYLPRLNMPRQSAHQAAQALDVQRLLGVQSTPRLEGDDGAPVALTSKKVMRFALDTLTRWCHSADPEVTARHIPRAPNLTDPQTRGALAEFVMPIARAAWADLRRETGVLRMTHDHYLKMWALGHPVLDTDVILLDEAQDTNDVLYGVLSAQEQAQRIVVGDSAQAIYGWRGAKDALARFVKDGAAELFLSQSFRFGPAIAELANEWLYLVGTPLRLRGHEGTESSLGPVDPPDAVLCRTNAGAMAVVMSELTLGRRVALVGGGGDIQKLAWAAVDLQSGRPTDHPELCGFATWSQVREYAEEEDGALRVLVTLIDDHGTDEILAAVERLSTETAAQTVVSTAHKAKGREWAAVRLYDDFTAPKRDITGNMIISREYARVIYVAVTRARYRLDAAAVAWGSSVTAVKD